VSDYGRLPGVGTASVFKGDPRLPENDIDSWYNSLLGEVHPAKMRAHLYGADAGLCARKNVLLEHNTWIPGEVTPASAGYMAIGVALEDLLANSLRRHGRLVTQGMYLIDMPVLKIRGKIDLIAFDFQDELCLIEVKTCGKLPTEPKHDHLAQIQTYCAVSGITRAWLTYMSRDVRSDYGPKMAIRSFPVETGSEALYKRLETASLSLLASKEGMLPPVPATFRKHTECHYCSFRDHFCWRTRPGLPGAPSVEPTAPLPEYTPVELIHLYTKAGVIATDLMSEIVNRKYQTLTFIEETIENIPEGIEEKLFKIKEATLQELLV